VNSHGATRAAASIESCALPALRVLAMRRPVGERVAGLARASERATHMKCALNAIVAAIVLMLSFAAPITAGQFEDATAAYHRGDYATALRLYRALADQGNAEAQYNLGIMYSIGWGVLQDDAEAAKWFRLAANQFRLAADQGDAQAQAGLGQLYYIGRGVPQDYAEATKWFRLAANQSNAEAQAMLGVMYENGQGVPKDDVLAYMWLNLAALQRNMFAPKERDDLAQRMTPEQIAEAQKLASEWKPTRGTHMEWFVAAALVAIVALLIALYRRALNERRQV